MSAAVGRAKDTAPSVEVVGLSYTFIGRDRPSLRDIAFSLPPASWTVVAGRTGSGKSTLLRALAGLIPHHAAGQMLGCVNLLGDDTRTLGPAERARRVGLILQSPNDQLCTTMVEAEVAFGLENLGLPPDEIGRRIDAALAMSGLTQLRRRPTRHLSGGQKQRLLMASIGALSPRVLLLDEPLAQLDSLAAAELLAELDRMRSQGVTIVVAEHRLDDLLPLADRMLVFDEGHLVEDVPAASADLYQALARHGLAPPEVSQLAHTLGCDPIGSMEALLEDLDPRIVDSGAVAASRGTESRGDEITRTTASAENAAVVLRVNDLGYRFPGSSDWLWRGLDVALHHGDRVALVGANGSGKSTLLHLLAGFAPPSAGSIGRQPAAITQFESPVGLVPQNPDLTLFCATVRKELAFGPTQIGGDPATIEERLVELARRFHLASLLDDPPLALSQGQRLRTAVAAALSVNPCLLLLDEPTTGQDREQVERVMSAVSQPLREPDGRSRAIGCMLFSTHDLSIVARYASRVLVLDAGRLVADCTPDELLADDALLARAHLRRTPLLQIRHRLALHGLSVAEIAAEIRALSAHPLGLRRAMDRPGPGARGAGA